MTQFSILKDDNDQVFEVTFDSEDPGGCLMFRCFEIRSEGDRPASITREEAIVLRNNLEYWIEGNR